MKKTEPIYDRELETEGLRRCTVTDWVITTHGVVPIYRERTMNIAQYQQDPTPWWKKTKKRRSRK